MNLQEVLMRSIEIVEKDPERIIATEFMNSHRKEIEGLVGDLDKETVFAIVLAAMKFYRDRLREAMWEGELGAKLREYLRRVIAVRIEVIKRQNNQDENGMYG